jgi:hypothetical protein
MFIESSDDELMFSNEASDFVAAAGLNSTSSSLLADVQSVALPPPSLPPSGDYDYERMYLVESNMDQKDYAFIGLCICIFVLLFCFITLAYNLSFHLFNSLFQCAKSDSICLLTNRKLKANLALENDLTSIIVNEANGSQLTRKEESCDKSRQSFDSLEHVLEKHKKNKANYYGTAIKYKFEEPIDFELEPSKSWQRQENKYVKTRGEPRDINNRANLSLTTFKSSASGVSSSKPIELKIEKINGASGDEKKRMLSDDKMMTADFLNIYNSFNELSANSKSLADPMEEFELIERTLSKSLCELNEIHKKLHSNNINQRHRIFIETETDNEHNTASDESNTFQKD